MAWWAADRGRRTGRRLLVTGAVAVFALGSAPASAREPAEPAVPSVVTFEPVGSGWREVQNTALDALPGPRPTVQAQLATGNVLLAELTADQRRQLAARPEVLGVAVDAPLITDPVTTQRSAAADAATPPASPPPTAAPATACTGTADRGQLEPQALDSLRVRSDDPAQATAASLGYDGAGVTVGILTTAFDPDVPDFQRPDGTSAVVDYRSYVSGGPGAGGTALEGFGDVSAIVAQGAVTHDLATVVNPAAVTLPDGHCYIRIVGVAPGADVIGSDIYDGSTITVGAAVRSIDDAVAAGADVLSQSYGWNDVPDASLRQAVFAANAAAIDAGVTVVASSGDAGANSTIVGPAADPRVIAVGASIDGRLAAQVGAQGVTRFGNGTWPSGTSSVISSSGFTVDGGTVDVLAPGDADWSVCTTNLLYTGCLPVGGGAPSADFFPFSGTSQSAPFVAGVAALVIQAYRETHDGARPTPDQVQRVLTGTAADLGLPAQAQGSGLVDAHAAVLAARRLDTSAAVAPASGPARTLVADSAQRTLTGTGQRDLSVQVTNTGSTPVVLDGSSVTRDVPSGRQTFPIAFDAQTPTFTDGVYNLPMTSTRQTFTVAPGAAQIDLAVAGVPQNPNLAVYIAQLTVLDPSGAPVAYASSSSGLQVQVPRPAAGEWTAVVQAPAILAFRGELSVQRTERQVIAPVRPDDAVLLPGATTTLRSAVPMPGAAGDAAATLSVPGQLALPVVLRVPVDLGSGAAALGGTARPQNGRGGSPSQQAIWEFDVPAGRRSLDVSAVLDAPAQAQLTGVLIGPDGLARSTTSTANADQIGQGSAVDQSVVAPEPGRWRYVLGLWGTSWSEPATAAAFRVSLTLDGRRAAATGLPAGESLTMGTTRTVTLSLDNPGPAPLSVAVDARTDARAEVDLPVVGTGPTVTLPVQRYLPVDGSDALPRVVVPPFSSRLSVSTRSTVPVLLAAVAPAGAPAVQSDVGRAGGPAATSTEAQVSVADAGQAPGPWSIWLMPPGPTTAATPDGTATVAARVETAAYDPTVTDATTGQPFVTATGPAAGATPTLVPAGGRFAVPVTLPVRGAPGDRVSGFLALTVPAQVGSATDQLAPADRSGDVLAVFRYDYTVAAAPDPSTTTPPPDPTTTAPQPTTTAVPTVTVPTVTMPTMTMPTVTMPTVTFAPVTLAPFTVAVAPPVFAPQPTVSAAPAGTLPVTGVDLVPLLMSSGALLLAGTVLLVTGRRLRRERRG